MPDPLAPYLRQIRARYPDLPVRTARLAERGQNNAVLVLDDALVFRFPRYGAGIAPLQREVRLLRALRGALPLPIPDPIYASFAPRAPGHSFMGYPLLPGAPLDRGTVAALDCVRRGRIGAQLVDFLTRLHALPRDVIPDAAPPADVRDRWADLLARIERSLFPLMRSDARAEVAARFAAFLDDPRNGAIAPAIVHGDFGGSNILYDAGTEEVTGVIDFGSAGLGDPAVDLAAVSTLGDELMAAIAARYPGAGALAGRAVFYRGTFALQEALFGVEQGDTAAVRAGLADYT